MHCDCSLDSHVWVFLRRIKVFKFLIQLEELHFDSSTTWECVGLRASHDNLPFRIELTRDLVLVSLDKLVNHGPYHMLLLAFCWWHWLTQILKIWFGFFKLFPYFIDDLWQIMLDMRKQYSWQFGRQDFTSEQSWWHRWVNRMRVEEWLFLIFCFLHT